MPVFTRRRIGTAIIKWVKESTGHRVAFGQDDGFRSDDGSHLTGNGPAFAEHIYELIQNKILLAYLKQNNKVKQGKGPFYL